MAENVKPVSNPLTQEQYHELRGERENIPGVAVVGGHVAYDAFAMKYGLPPMTDEELPIELQTKNVDHPEDEDIDFPAPEPPTRVRNHR